MAGEEEVEAYASGTALRHLEALDEEFVDRALNLGVDSGLVLDVGTGSGVLAIVAARLGAAFVTAIDVDPEAVANARENIARNHVAHLVEAHVRDVSDAALAPADLVTANLTGTLLARYAPSLARLVRPAGSVIVAGFTVNERSIVMDAFAGTLSVSESAEEDDWWAYVLTPV